MKQTFIDNIVPGGKFVENPKNVLIGQCYGFNVIIKKLKSNLYELAFNVDRGMGSMNSLMNFLYKEIGVDRCVKCCVYENSTIKITLKTKKAEEQLKNMIITVTSKLSSIGMSTGCGFCGKQGNHRTYSVKGKVMTLCDDCYENYYEMVYGKKLKKFKRDHNIVDTSKSRATGTSPIEKKNNNNIIALPVADVKLLTMQSKPIVKNNVTPFALPEKKLEIQDNTINLFKKSVELPKKSIEESKKLDSDKKEKISKRALPATQKNLPIISNTSGALALDDKKVENTLPEKKVLPLATTSFTSVVKDIEQDNTVSSYKRVLIDILSAFTGSLLGVFIWVLAYELQIKFIGLEAITEFAAIAMPAFTILGFFKFGGKFDKRGIIICNVIIVFMIYFAFNLTVALNISSMEAGVGENLSLIGAFKSIPYVLSNNDANAKAYASTLIGSYILAIVVDIFTIYTVRTKKNI